MIFRNHIEIQKSVIAFTIRAWLFWEAYHSRNPKACLGLTNLDKLVNESKQIESKTGDEYLPDYDTGIFHSDPDCVETSHACRFFKISRRLVCNGSIDYAYLNGIRNEPIDDFIVENYEAESFYKRRYGSPVETGEWYLKLPKLYQKLTGEIELKDTGLRISVNVRLLPNKMLKGFFLEGEAFLNKIIKISWRLKGNLFLDFIKNKTVILLNAEAIGDDDWKLQANLTYFKRADDEDEADGWKAVGVIKSDYISENQFVFYKGTIWTKILGQECKFFGEVKLSNVNLEVFLSGNVAPPQKKQIAIPKSAFSNMTIQNIIFKDSHFYKDFEKNSFEGLQGVKTISFTGSKLEIDPRLDELFQNFSDLEEIHIEECFAPRIKLGSLAVLKHVQKLSFKGSGPLNFDDTSFLWLRNSNLSFLSLRNSHVKVSSTASSVLWSVKSTLKHLDISHSTLNKEKDLMTILNNLNIVTLTAEGLKLTKIPTNALSSVRKTLLYLSLKENDFGKHFEKNLFDSILSFPLMERLKELNLEECRINFIEKGIFDNFPNLKVLRLSYNNLENIQDGWTYVTPRLTYLGLSYNGFTPQVSNMALYSMGTCTNLSKFKNLEILDLSNGIFTSINKLVGSLGSSVKTLSLQNTRLEDVPDNLFENLTGLENLDLSYNRNLKVGQPFSFNLFKNLKNLKSLNLKYCRISGIDISQDDLLKIENSEDFKFNNLQSLDLSLNNLKILDTKILRMLPQLKILNLSGNGITEWSKLLSFNEHLETVFWDENKIETITNEMLSDIKRLKHVKLGNNPFVCGSYVYEIIKIVNAAAKTQYKPPQSSLPHDYDFRSLEESDFIRKIFYKTKRNQEIISSENLKILDWSEKNFFCFSWTQSKFIPFLEVNENFQDSSKKEADRIEVTLLWLIFVVVVGVVISVAIICWKFLDIHLITRAVRNAVALSFIGRNEKEPANFRYNVFVSYSDKDRHWVVENLLPRLESKNEVKVCLHERDFQVGISIIENILNSIENSKNIILVVSQAFLKSQWCQYEMQLAQFRLLEKGRDQLIIILLENIPLVKRPKTLRYLMMTKTYLEWPQTPKSFGEIDNFWNRLMKSLENLN